MGFCVYVSRDLTKAKRMQRGEKKHEFNSKSLFLLLVLRNENNILEKTRSTSHLVCSHCSIYIYRSRYKSELRNIFQIIIGFSMLRCAHRKRFVYIVTNVHTSLSTSPTTTATTTTKSHSIEMHTGCYSILW